MSVDVDFAVLEHNVEGATNYTGPEPVEIVSEDDNGADV